MSLNQHPSTRPLDSKRRGRLVIGLVGVAIGLAYLFHDREYPLGSAGQPGAGVFPLVVGVGFVAVSILTCVEALFTTAVTGKVSWPTRDRLLVMLGFGAAMVGYVVLLPWLGQYLCGVLFMVVSLKILSKHSWIACVLWGTAIGLALSAFFIDVLSAVLPLGPFG